MKTKISFSSKLQFSDEVMMFVYFQRLLPIEGQSDMFLPPKKLISGNRVFTIRPYYEEDRVSLCGKCMGGCVVCENIQEN